MYAFDAKDCIHWLQWLRRCWDLLQDMPKKMDGDVCIIDDGITQPKLPDESQDDQDAFCFRQRCLLFFARTGTMEQVMHKERCGQAIDRGEIMGLVEGQLQELQFIFDSAQRGLCDNLDVILDINLDPEVQNRLDDLIVWLESSE